MDLWCHFTRRKKKSVPFIINHSHAVLWQTNRLLERNKTRGVLNHGDTQLWSSNSHTSGDVWAKALCRWVCKGIVQRHTDMPWTFAEAPGIWQINIWKRKVMEGKFQIKKQIAKPGYICIFYHSNLYQWWRWNKPVIWSSCGRNQWHNSHWPAGSGLGFEIKSCPDEQQWEKQNILCSSLVTQMASIIYRLYSPVLVPENESPSKLSVPVTSKNTMQPWRFRESPGLLLILLLFSNSL